jgi:hypothetical protein
MTRTNLWLRTALLLFLTVVASLGQESSTNTVVPTLVNFGGKLTDINGKPLVGTVGVTFYLYKDSQDQTPLWMESQNVQCDNHGVYSVTLGSTKSEGLPTDVFVSGEARWLGVKIDNQAEQPRVLLVSVPYALKAADAQTVGGLPPSAFVLATPAAVSTTNYSSSPAAVALPPSGAVTGTGTVNFVPLWDSTSDIVSSVIFQSGSGSSAKIGIGTTTPAVTLDVKGTSTVRGVLTLPATGTATASTSFNSQPLSLAASVFNSSNGTAAPQNFRLLAEPVGNDTASASGTLNLQFASGSNPFNETGLKIASNGQITFASGQTFPGTGSGTVTSVGSGSGLTGGPITSSGALSVATGGITNAMLQNSSVTITPGTDLTGGGSVALGSSIALNLDTTKVPQLATNNTFAGTISATSFSGSGSAITNLQGSNVQGSVATANNALELGGFPPSFYQQAGNYATLGGNNFNGDQNVTGNVTATATVTGVVVNASGSFNLGGNTFALGSFASENAFVGFAGNSTTTANGNTANGYSALHSVGTGGLNVASGYNALSSNTSGSLNTANGYGALNSNTTASNNTAIGGNALGLNTTGPLNTATGYGSLINNTTGQGNTAVGFAALQNNTTGNDNTSIGIGAGPDVNSPNLTNSTAIGYNAIVSESSALILGGTGSFAVNVGIGTPTPSRVFTIAQFAGHAIADGWDTYSSRRWKTNIHTLHGALQKVEQLRGVTYDLKANGKHEVGVIAEEVGAVVPEVVTWEKNGTDAQGVDYSRLTALLIEATKEQQALITEQRREIASQQAQIVRLASQVQAIRASIKTNAREIQPLRVRLPIALKQDH